MGRVGFWFWAIAGRDASSVSKDRRLGPQDFTLVIVYSKSPAARVKRLSRRMNTNIGVRYNWMVRCFLGGFILVCVVCGATLQFVTVDRAIVEERLRAAGSTNEQREQIVRDLFLQAGCPEGGLEELPVRHVKVPNVACTLNGEEASTIMVGAHFDFVRRGKGIIDNWSGASLLPSLLQSIVKQPRHHRFVFISFSEEEKGLIGSKDYVSHLGQERLRSIGAMINLDSLGAGETNVELERGDKRLVEALGLVAASMKLPLHAVNVHRVGRSDSDSFQDVHVPTILVHSITQPTLRVLHSFDDQLNAVQMDNYYDSYRLLAAYLVYLDQKLDTFN
jgi:hypothetical protein